MTTFSVGYFVGSLSSKSINRLLAKALIRLAPPALEFSEVPFKDLPLYSPDYEANYPPVATALKEAIAKSDAVLFVTPEYNRSIPGGLKNALDWASRPYGKNSFARKPSAVIGTSPGLIATAIAQQHLRSLLGYCNSPQMNSPEAYIQFKPGLITEEGEVTNESTEAFLRNFMSEFHQFIVRVYTVLPRNVLLLFALLCAAAAPLSAQRPVYDRVILNGRVMDPESGLDAPRNVGIRAGRIASITAARITGKDTVDARGLVVSPGFIDLHSHWQTPAGYRFAALDGVTTALELEGGAWPVPQWYQEREGKSLINFGATVSHGRTRAEVVQPVGTLDQALTAQDTLVFRNPWAYRRATPEQVTQLQALISRGLEEGALGIGFGLAYTPGAGRDEIFKLFQTGAAFGVTSFVHVRHAALSVNSGSIDAAQEVIADATAAGASLHIVHVTSTGLSDTPVVLEMIAGARKRGVDVTTELYPYEAASTGIQAAIFDPGWQDRLGVKEDAVLYTKTGERLTPETFAQYRKVGGTIVIFVIPKEAMYAAARTPGVMFASDGVEIINNTGHPRGAGTFARVLGRFVREEQILPLMDALRRMTLLPARRLEAASPAMKRKGRLKVGADADIAVFDPGTVIDNATFEKPEQASSGIPFVLVNGVVVVRDGKAVEDTLPGVGIKREVRKPAPTG